MYDRSDTGTFTVLIRQSVKTRSWQRTSLSMRGLTGTTRASAILPEYARHLLALPMPALDLVWIGDCELTSEMAETGKACEFGACWLVEVLQSDRVVVTLTYTLWALRRQVSSVSRIGIPMPHNAPNRI